MSKLTDTNAVPNPGSDEAITRGCKCARMDNAYGKGYHGMPGVFVYTVGCPLHCPDVTAETLFPQERTPNG